MIHMSIAVFTVKDARESLAYYREKVGFEVAFEYGKPTFYVGLSSGDVAPEDYDVADMDGNMIFFGMEPKKV